MRHAPLFLIALFVLLLSTQDVQAQNRGQRKKHKDKDHEEQRDRRRDRDDEDWSDEDDWEDVDGWEDDDKWETRRQKRRRQKRRRKKNGPPFCRNGQGHPVHGRQWCIDKGYGLGDRYDDRYRRYDERRWRRVRARNIRLDVSLFDRLLGGGRLDEDALERTLGRDAFYRLRDYQRRLGLRGRLTGRLLERGGVLDGRRERHELRVEADGRDLARFIDRDGDERVDVILLRRRR